MKHFTAPTTLLTAAACASTQVGPTAMEFASLHAAQCADHAAQARDARCRAIEEEPTEFSCTYTLPEIGGGWKKYQAYVAIDGAKWVWLDGETRCATSAISNLN